jgi:hypothetical protein
MLDECIAFYRDQRDLSHRVVLHCDSAIGRTGVFAVSFTFIGDVVSGKGVADVMALSMLLSDGRKNLLSDKKHLLYTYQLALRYLIKCLVECKYSRGKTTKTEVQYQGVYWQPKQPKASK